MSKAKMGTNPNSMPSIPGSNFSRPSGSSSVATSDNPERLIYAMLFGNRETKRLAKQKLKSSKYHKFMKRIGSAT